MEQIVNDRMHISSLCFFYGDVEDLGPAKTITVHGVNFLYTQLKFLRGNDSSLLVVYYGLWTNDFVTTLIRLQGVN